MEQFFHSVTLDRNLCKGCTNCVKRCPTEAIRVRNGKARIIKERCIDCGECIRICPEHAKKALFDSVEIMKNFRYTVALPAPALFGQFNNLDDIEIVLAALKSMGFDEVYEVARAAEIVSDCTRKVIASGKLKLPIINSACPAVVRLIRVRFPELIENILPFRAPVEIAARAAKREASLRTGIPYDEIGAIFITPCPAKVTAMKMPLGTAVSHINGALAISDIYPTLLSHMRNADTTDEVALSGRIGIGWGSSGGESSALLNDKYLAADGIENVIRVLEDLEDDKFAGLEFIELNACNGGCVGGVLTVENPFAAKAKLKRIRKYRPISCNHVDDGNYDVKWDKAPEYMPVLSLDKDRHIAMIKLNRLREIEAHLYGLDCGACGAPSCAALAEDIVRGFATEEYCIYRLRENLGLATVGAHGSSNPLPLAFRQDHDELEEHKNRF